MKIDTTLAVAVTWSSKLHPNATVREQCVTGTGHRGKLMVTVTNNLSNSNKVANDKGSLYEFSYIMLYLSAMLGERITPTKDSVSNGRRNNGETVPCDDINIIPHRSNIQGEQMTIVTGNTGSNSMAKETMVIHNSSDNVSLIFSKRLVHVVFRCL